MVIILADFISKVEISNTLSIPYKNVNFAKTPSSLVTKQFSGDYITVVMMIGGVLIIVIIVVDEGVFSSIEDI